MAAQAPPTQLTNLGFLSATRPKRIVQITNQAYADGGSNRFQLPQAGLLDKIWHYVSATITVAGTVTSGTFNGFGQNGATQAPYSMLNTYKFYSNNNLILRNLGGWSLYKWIRTRYGLDYTKCTAVNYSANTLAALGANQSSGAIVAGANVAASTYTFNWGFPVDVAYNQTAESCLISAQNGNIYYYSEFDWGQITGGLTATGGSNALFNALVGTGLSVTASINTSMTVDIWDYPLLPPQYSFTNLMKSFLSASDGIKTPLNNGLNTFQPPQNDYYTMIITEWINNGAPVAVANLQSPSWQYAGNVYPFLDNYAPLLARDYYEKKIPAIDGTIPYDFGMRRGERLRRDTIDAFQDQNITNLTLNTTLPGSLSITGVNQMNYVLENINNFSQPTTQSTTG